MKRKESEGDMDEELKKLRAENVALKQNQELLFLVLDIGMGAVERWAKENGLLALEESVNQNISDGDNQVRIFLEQIRKSDQDALLNRLIGLLDRLKGRQKEIDRPSRKQSISEKDLNALKEISENQIQELFRLSHKNGISG